MLEEATIKRQNLQSLLEDNLMKRRDELTESSPRARPGATNTSANQAVLKEELEQKKRELEEATQALEDAEKQLTEVKFVDENLRSEIATIKNDLEKLKTQDARYQKELEDTHAEQEKLLNKRSMCIQRREDYMRKIQELGSLPPTAELTTFNKKSISALMKSLDDINRKLKKYSHVNKKAFDQFVNFRSVLRCDLYSRLLVLPHSMLTHLMFIYSVNNVILSLNERRNLTREGLKSKS